MPQINENLEQKRALDAITRLIGEVKTLNQLINLDNGKTFKISAGADKSTAIVIDTNQNEKIKSIAKACRARRVKDINQSLKKYSISLTEKEQAIVSDKAIGLTAAEEDGEEETVPVVVSEVPDVPEEDKFFNDDIPETGEQINLFGK